MAKSKFRKLPRHIQVILAVIVVVVIAVSWYMQNQPVMLPEGEMVVTMIDVGNADSFLIQCGAQSMLIDAGERGDSDTVLDALEENGVKTLDYVIATHADSDHIGGMQEVIENIEVKNYIMAFMPQGHTPTTKTYINLLGAVDTLDIPLIEAQVGSHFTLGEARVDILGPADDFEDKNNQSVVCKVTFGEKKFLFMGDAETQAEEALLATGADLRADVLKAGHHGSSTSSTQALLDRVKPQIVLVPCGADNAYGHPHREFLKRMQNLQVEMYRADVNGTVQLRCDGKTIEVVPQKGEAA